MNNRDHVICRECNGEGELIMEPYPADVFQFPPECHTYTCGGCRGRGVREPYPPAPPPYPLTCTPTGWDQDILGYLASGDADSTECEIVEELYDRSILRSVSMIRQRLQFLRLVKWIDSDNRLTDTGMIALADQSNEELMF